jgi:hypothetical protein
VEMVSVLIRAGATLEARAVSILFLSHQFV